MNLIDVLIFIVYGLIVILVGNIFAGRKGKVTGTNDYFFANKSLPWFVVGSSIIAANISAELVHRDVRFRLCHRTCYCYL